MLCSFHQRFAMQIIVKNSFPPATPCFLDPCVFAIIYLTTAFLGELLTVL
jgi:hypothetical protein